MASAPSQALLADLESFLGPKGFTRDAADMAPWLKDWRGRWQGAAAAMLSPASTREVQAIVALCAAARVAIVPQGGNTSMVGGATPSPKGDGVLLSLRRMNAIRRVSAEDNMIVAESGVILSDLHEAAEAAGRRFPLSLAAKGSATVGGLVSTNAGGTQVLRFGPMRALVLGLEAVMTDGSLYQGLSALRKDNRGFDPGQLLVGAEGTLGIVTAASLRLVAAPAARSVAWVGLVSPTDALALLRRLEDRLGDAVESFELVPDDALALVLNHIGDTRAPLAGRHGWHVLVEAAFASPEEAPRLEQALGEALDNGLLQDAVVARSEAQAAGLWRLRESIAEAERHQGEALKHDISVPVSAMPAFIVEAREALEARFPGCRVVAFGHLGDGNVHFNILPPSGPGAADWLQDCGPEASDLVYRRVRDAGGSISAEHGIGQMKREAMAAFTDPARLAAQRAIKAALDPNGIMNPGKVFAPPP